MVTDRDRVMELGKMLNHMSNMAFDNWKLTDAEREEIFRGMDIIGDALQHHHRRVNNLQMTEDEHLRRLILLRSPIMR